MQHRRWKYERKSNDAFLNLSFDVAQDQETLRILFNNNDIINSYKKRIESNYILTDKPKYMSNERNSDGTRTKRCI